MNQRVAVLVAGGVLVLLAGCATLPWSACQPIAFEGPIPKTVPPREWRPDPGHPEYVHVQFVADPNNNDVYAIGVTVVDGFRPSDFFIVGPMKGLSEPYPYDDEDAAHARLKKEPGGWYEFYQGLSRGYRHNRPMGLVCPAGKDCQTTPESPPPYLHGMTATLHAGTTAPLAGAQGSLNPSTAYASLDREGGSTAADALKSTVVAQTPELDQQRRRIVSEVVTRAVCAARTLSWSPPTSK